MFTTFPFVLIIYIYIIAKANINYRKNKAVTVIKIYAYSDMSGISTAVDREKYIRRDSAGHVFCIYKCSFNVSTAPERSILQHSLY